MTTTGRRSRHRSRRRGRHSERSVPLRALTGDLRTDLRVYRSGNGGDARCRPGTPSAKLDFVTGSIVVGVDGSVESQRALRWAVEEARLRKAEIVAVHAWWAFPDLAPVATLSGADWKTIRSQEASTRVQEFIDDTLGGARRDIAITTRPVQGITATEALVEAAKDADLLVIGSRGLGRFKGMLGSVSRGCLQHAHCPVVVIHGQPGQGDKRLEGVA